MYNRIENLKKNLPEKHQNIAVLTGHIFEAFDHLIEEHRHYVGVNATAKIQPNPDEERTFFETINQVKQIILTELEKTAEDIGHKGDKNWVKNYPDGVE
ncbi:hypothetical protein CEF21_07240 [Bacillus sp. FJAT-42376]|uniref:hypothetical protein n=1 Tax=Bacillus sp. FJAT-42376 TaxID=2014076 RepID=UPI000F516AF5|nr:hypothetical protein [Bacillus sp. FJAT-42376]AZB42101.1 hypothetical protein CEF21_07240 [Bacillus sp. FJAT-42376]